MKPISHLVRNALLIFLFSSSLQAGTTDQTELKNDPDRCDEFMDWGVGMFIHWSLDSELGSVISHSMVGASEDYLDRYLNDLPRYFNPMEYDPAAWAKLASLAGFKYMVFTTKHHNGFCMWPTKTTDFSITTTPCKRDLVKEYVEACRKYGLKVGFYFSPEDFHFLHRQGHVIRRHGSYTQVSDNPELLEFNKKQIDELLSNYGPIDIVFLDAFDNAPIRQYIHQVQPSCLVTRGEMETPEQYIPNTPLPGPWEANFTMGTQWQYKPTNEHYKSGSKLIEMLIDIRAKGGNLLINMGPEPSGKIPFEQERRFREMALWMMINGESIHNVRPAPLVKEENIWFTRSAKVPDTVYLFIPHGEEFWKHGIRREYTIKSLSATDKTRISVLGQNDKVVEYKGRTDATSRFKPIDEGLEISVVRAQRIYNNASWPNPMVVKLEGVEFVAKQVGIANKSIDKDK